MDEQQSPPAPRIARRRIAYVCTGALCGTVAAAFAFPLDEPNADIVIAGVYMFAAVVGGYMGAQIAPEVFKRR